MAELILSMLAAVAAQILFSRLLTAVVRPLGETVRRLALAQLLAYLVATLALSLAFARLDGGTPRLGFHAAAGLPALVLWAVVDIHLLLRRRAKLRDAWAISRMR